MQSTGLGRFVFIAQWVAAVILPFFFVIGRVFVGAEPGWLMVIGIFYGLIMIVLMLVPPLIALFDTQSRRARATRPAYSWVSLVMWIALIIGALTVPDGGDQGMSRPALTVWTGDAISIDASGAIFSVVGTISGLAYLAAFVLAIVGVAKGRGAAAAAY